MQTVFVQQSAGLVAQMHVQIVGWASSAILLATMLAQIHKQWSEKKSAGVSPWLFIGQLAACAGFVFYSLHVKNWVFAVSNGALFLTNILGLVLTLRFRGDEAAAQRKVDP